MIKTLSSKRKKPGRIINAVSSAEKGKITMSAFQKQH